MHTIHRTKQEPFFSLSLGAIAILLLICPASFTLIAWIFDLPDGIFGIALSTAAILGSKQIRG